MSATVVDTAAPHTLDDCWNRIGVWSRAAERCPRLSETIHCHNCAIYAAAGQRLLDREPPAGYRAEWTRHLHGDKAPAQSAQHAAFIFRLGDEWFGLDAGVLREVTEMCAMHSLPHNRSAVVRGLANIRGELHLCVSLGHLFGLERATGAAAVRSANERLVVIQDGGERFVFPVSEVRGVHRYRNEDLGPAPTTVANASGTFVAGILDADGRRVGCLDASLLFHALRARLRQ